MKQISYDIIRGDSTPLIMEHSIYYYDYDRNDLDRENPFMTEEDRIEFNIEANSPYNDGYTREFYKQQLMENLEISSNKGWKYNEEEILKELNDYISGTYNQHYSAGDDKIQTLDLIEACGDGEAFCRSNILKYASRYDKKGTARRDILKILHYAVLLLHFNDKNAQRETYPQ